MSALERIHQLRAEVAELIEALLKEHPDSTHRWHPRIDLVDFDDHFEVRMELPGVAAADLHIEIKDQALKIRGDKRNTTPEPPGLRYHLMERYVGGFEISLEVPRSVMAPSSSARLENGVLAITLPKIADKRHRSYVITVNEERK